MDSIRIVLFVASVACGDRCDKYLLGVSCARSGGRTTHYGLFVDLVASGDQIDKPGGLLESPGWRMAGALRVRTGNAMM